MQQKHSLQKRKKEEKKISLCIMNLSINTEKISSEKRGKKKKEKYEIRDSSRNKNVQRDKYF